MERRQLLPDLPERLRQKERRRGGQGGKDKARIREKKKSGRLVGTPETSKERAECRRLQRKT